MNLATLIIIGIWGSIILIGMVLVKLERTKAECWTFINEYCNCKDCKEESEDK